MHVRGATRLLLALSLGLAAAATPVSDALAAKKKASSARAPSIAAAIVVDMNSGSILYSQAADASRYPASLTKIMTLYVLFGYMRAGKLTPSSDLTVTPHAASQAPTKLGLKPGATIKMSDAIKALVTQSANDAAVTIAENLAGTEENFARLMTETARRIGMRNTTFRNASGLPNDEQITTARDMAILAAHLIHDYPEYYSVFETRYFSFKGRKYRNHNKLLVRLQGHRRHQDRLHAGKRLQSHGLRASRQQTPCSGCARRQDRQPARRRHAFPARQALRRRLRHQAFTRATRRFAGDAAGVAGGEEAGLGAGAGDAGSDASFLSRRRRYHRAD